MRVGLLAGIAVASSACDLVFPLDGEIEVAPPAGLRCERVDERITLPLIADSFLANGDVTAHGGESQLFVYQPTDSRVLLRFQTGRLGLSRFDLTLKPRQLCGSSCTPCVDGNAGGRISARAVRPDWDEATVTEQVLGGATLWTELPGPVFPDASSMLVGSSIFVAPSDAFTLAIDTAGVDSSGWPSTGELALLLFADDVNFEVSATFSSKDDTCASPGDAPLLSAVCTLEALCGNGVQDANEACDDGNDIDDDACTNACTSGA